ncbi:MAG: DUF4340 domain-containing protein [Akkermansiaceae bacterium]
MRYAATILLLLIASILVGLSVAYTGGKYHEIIFGSTPLQQGEKLFNVDQLAEVRNITLKNNDGAEASFIFQNNAWQSTSPWKDRADQTLLLSLIQITNELTVQEITPVKNLELSSFGLDSESNSIRVSMSDQDGRPLADFYIGKPTALHISEKTDTETKLIPTIFIRLADKKLRNNIYICSLPTADTLHLLFKDNFSRFRDHHPFHFHPQLLDRVTLQSKMGEVVLSRKDLNSGWLITKPLVLKADPEALKKLFSDLNRLTALQIDERIDITLPTSEIEGTQTAQRVSMHFAGAEKDITLQIYPNAENDAYSLATISNRPDIVFHLPNSTDASSGVSSLDDLQIGVNGLRSKTMVHLSAKLLNTIVIRPRSRPPLLLKRESGKPWQLLSIDGWKQPHLETLSELIEAVVDDKIQKFVTDAATDLSLYGLDNPILQIGFNGFDGSGIALAIGRNPEGEEIYAHLTDSPHIWQISPKTLGKIATRAWQWRSPNVWHIPKVDINRITIQKRGEPITDLQYAYFSGEWTAKRGGKLANAALNPNRADTLLTNIESLSTMRWLGPDEAIVAKFLETPDLSISVHVTPFDNEGNELSPIIKTLKIAHTPNKSLHYAKISTEPQTPASMKDDENYFMLPSEIISQLSVNLFE